MPPREANTPFPDQYLTLDYDASAPAIPHDPTPIPVNDMTAPDDQFGMPAAAADPDANFASPSGDNDSHGPIGASHSVTGTPQTTTRVDPLSIDPTSSDPSLLAQFTAEEGGFDMGPTPSYHTLFSLRRSFGSIDENPPPHTVSPPPPLTESSVSSPGGFTTSSIASFDFFSASEGTATPSYPRNSSVLDHTLSDGDDDDDDTSSVPDLDITNDSTTAISVTDHITASPSTDSSAFSFSGYDNNVENTALSLTFSPTTTVSDLKYFAERGCIVPLLAALSTPRLKTLGCRMLADYAKMPNRRVAVASNKRILEFVLACMTQPGLPDWMGREYAVETVRSLTATEESDGYLMGTDGMLETLALCARGGPFGESSDSNGASIGLASPRGRLHACIAIMNLSCGKSNKIEIAKCQAVLETMRDVMLCTTGVNAAEARLKATTCVKNLSNADANDAALLHCPGLVEALGTVARTAGNGSPTTTTNACLALMNLSISKMNKHRVFVTPGVMDALIHVISQEGNNEAKVKACSALSNLAIGYDNKIPMFEYPGFVNAILRVIKDDVGGEARTKACSILWSFAAEMKNQVPVVRRGDILPILVQVAEEDTTTEARFKCVAALTLLAESLENALPLLRSGALVPLMNILHEAGPDPTQWKGQTASWCVGFLMNLSQSDDAVPLLREAGVVELLAPLLTLNHYQSLKAAMAVTFVCRYDEDDTTYDLLRKTETVIPKIISLLHNTLAGKGGNGYKYGVFTLRSSVGCIASLASGPDFMKERIATGPVFDSLLQVLTDFCVDGGTQGAIVGGGRDDVISATLAIRALHSLTGHLIPIPGRSNLPFEPPMEEKLLTALESFEDYNKEGLARKDKDLAKEIRCMILGYELKMTETLEEMDGFGGPHGMAHAVVGCCGFPIGVGHSYHNRTSVVKAIPGPGHCEMEVIQLDNDDDEQDATSDEDTVRTFLLSDGKGRRFAVPIDPSGGRVFNDTRVWCYRRGRFCRVGETPDPNFRWTKELQRAYLAALQGQNSTTGKSKARK